MARLVVKPGSPDAWAIQLKPGINLIGRGFSNDFNIPDGSVSGSHCQITLGADGATIKDLGSTNGTFVNRIPVKESVLQPGQTIHLGQVELLFCPETAAKLVSALVGANVTSAGSPAIPLASPVKISAGPPTASREPMLPSDVGAARATAVADGPHNCKFHPRTPGRYLCNRCQVYFCEACVHSHSSGGVLHKCCRHCGGECIPVQVYLTRPAAPLGFWPRVPGAFIYPLRGAGVLSLIVGIVVCAILRCSEAMMHFGSIRMFIFGVILMMSAGGYLFAFLQNIVHSTTAEDRELPDLPGISNYLEDVMFPFFKLLALVMLCFCPAIVAIIWFAFGHQPFSLVAAVIAAGFGYLYLPMAFLAVAALDSIAAANPLVIVPSIIKVAPEYLFVILAFAAVLGLQTGGRMLMKLAFAEGWTTHSMPVLFGMMASLAFQALLVFYLFITVVHLLGLIFVAKKDRLGWLS